MKPGRTFIDVVGGHVDNNLFRLFFILIVVCFYDIYAAVCLIYRFHWFIVP